MCKEINFDDYKKKIDDIKFDIPKFETPDWFTKQTVSDFPAETKDVTISWECH